MSNLEFFLCILVVRRFPYYHLLKEYIVYNNTIKVYDIIEKYSMNKQSRSKRFLFTVHKIILKT